MRAAYASMDQALEVLSPYGPDLRNGLTNHAPMAAEALCAMGRPDAVRPWIERYRSGMLPWPAPRERITQDAWRSALGQWHRVGDWRAFFREELHGGPWRQVLARWAARLAPGICASAAHGVIRVGHAARSLAEAESPLRLLELADALASWAYAYQELPTSWRAADRTLRPREAITKVAVVPMAQRQFAGTITSSLVALNDFPEFAPVIGLLDVSGDASAVLPELADTFVRVYLANVHDVLTSIVFVHGVTSLAALGNLLPCLDDETARAALRYAWQASCGLYAAFGQTPHPPHGIEPPRDDAATLVDKAVAHGDEHAIKFTETCLRFHALNPSPVYLAAIRNALEVLPPARAALPR